MRFFGRAADDPIVKLLRGAALDAALATDHAGLRKAAEKVAKAVQAIGADRWSRFLSDAEARARDPATVAAVAQAEQPIDPKRDAIRPVYPIETLLGIGTAALEGRAIAAAWTAALKLVTEGWPAKPGAVPSSSPAEPTAATATPEDVGVRVSAERREYILEGDGNEAAAIDQALQCQAKANSPPAGPTIR